MKGDDKGNITIKIGDKDATIYHFIMVCPAQPHAAAVDGKTAQPQAPENKKPGVEKIEYRLENRSLKRATGLAIELPGMSAESVLRMRAPTGWTSSIWYRQAEPAIDRLAPEIIVDPEERMFAGVIWRAVEGGVRKGSTLSGFAIELAYPKVNPKVYKWVLDPKGHGIVLEEGYGNKGAWHVNALTPVRVDLAKKGREQLRKRLTGRKALG